MVRYCLEGVVGFIASQDGGVSPLPWLSTRLPPLRDLWLADWLTFRSGPFLKKNWTPPVQCLDAWTYLVWSGSSCRDGNHMPVWRDPSTYCKYLSSHSIWPILGWFGGAVGQWSRRVSVQEHVLQDSTTHITAFVQPHCKPWVALRYPSTTAPHYRFGKCGLRCRKL